MSRCANESSDPHTAPRAANASGSAARRHRRSQTYRGFDGQPSGRVDGPTTSGERRTVALRTRGCGRPFRSAKEAVVFCKLVAVVPGVAGTA
jgi:hypothetical protein